MAWKSFWVSDVGAATVVVSSEVVGGIRMSSTVSNSSSPPVSPSESSIWR